MALPQSLKTSMFAAAYGALAVAATGVPLHAADDGSWSQGKADPVVPRTNEVGRNKPCPCGSGKKFKFCCRGKTK